MWLIIFTSITSMEHRVINHFGIITDYAAKHKLTITPTQYTQLADYLSLLQEWNKDKVNLTAIVEPSEMVRKHLLDALTYMPLNPKPPARLIDVGSGGGIPGIVLAIVWPETHVTLVESVAKKTAFLVHVASHFGLPNVHIVSERAETLGQDKQYRAQYDMATARAVAELRVLVEYLLPLVRIGGKVYAPKGPTPHVEVEAAKTAITTLGGHLHDIVNINEPPLEPRTMVRIVKRRVTPGTYPRLAGTPSKKPL
jgi:16S rRNA (guanine527-N7)-methyltransferase